MILGGVSSHVMVVERVATRWRSQLLIDPPVHADVETNWVCRHRERVSYAKRGNDTPYSLWDVLGERDEEETAHSQSKDSDEWLYQLKDRARNPYDAYNEAVHLWVQGNCDLAKKKVAEAAGSTPAGAVLWDGIWVWEYVSGLWDFVVKFNDSTSNPTFSPQIPPHPHTQIPS